MTSAEPRATARRSAVARSRCDDHDRQARAGERHDDDGEQERREGQQHVHRAAHGRIEPAAEETGGETNRRSEAAREQHRPQSDDERGTSAVDDAAEHVAAKIVGPEQVLEAGRLQRRHDVLRSRRERSNQRREDRNQDQRHDEREAAARTGSASSTPIAGAPAITQRCRLGSLATRISAMPHPRIDETVAEIDEKVHAHDHDREGDYATLD